MWRVLASPWMVGVWATLVVVTVTFQSWFYLSVRSQFGHWQPVSARILESWIRRYVDENNEYVRDPVIKFAYTYQSVEYESDTPALRSYTLGASFVDRTEIVSRYKKGDVVTAKLHPKFPELCYLEVARFDFKSLLLITFGIMAVGIGSYLFATYVS